MVYKEFQIPHSIGLEIIYIPDNIFQASEAPEGPSCCGEVRKEQLQAAICKVSVIWADRAGRASLRAGATRLSTDGSDLTTQPISQHQHTRLHQDMRQHEGQ